MKNCEHRPEDIECYEIGRVKCLRCGFDDDQQEWMKQRQAILKAEKKYFLNEMGKCTHPYSKIITNGTKKIVICQCGEEMKIGEHTLLRQPYGIERTVYQDMTESEKSNMILILRRALERAHEKLEVSYCYSEYGMGIEHIPLVKRDMDKTGIERLSIRYQITESGFHEVSDSRERMKRKLIELGIDIEEYLLETEKL